MSALLRYVTVAAVVLGSTAIAAVGPPAFLPGAIPAHYFQSLPAGDVPNAMALDAGGNILMAGYTASQAFAAKIAPNGQTLIYIKTLGVGVAAAVAVDSAGNAYVAGGTTSPSFPITKGAWSTPFPANGQAAFVAKLDPLGNVVYSTVFASPTYASALGVAVNAAGEAFVTGQTTGNFPLIGSSIQPSYPENDYFLVRLNAAGNQPIYSVAGPGGSAVVVDQQDNAYVVGTAQPYQVPTTPNTFQETASGGGCPVGIMQIDFGAVVPPCQQQYVCKVNATATELYFCTFVTGNAQEIQPSIAIDNLHNIYLVGTTWSTQYPVTPDAMQSQNLVQLPPGPLLPEPLSGVLFPLFYAPVQPTGYFTELSADGRSLVYSTYLGGSQADRITGVGLDAQSNVYISAVAQSPNFPGLAAAPERCLPGPLRATPVLTRLDSTGAHSVLVEGPATANLMVFNALAGAWLYSGSQGLTHVPLGGATAQDAIACVLDGLDFAQAGPIAQGELLTIFGNQIGPPEPLSNTNATPPTIFGGTSVTIAGIPAPLLYAGPSQINLEVPANVGTQSPVPLVLTSPGGVVTQRTLAPAAQSPSLLTDYETGYAACNGTPVLTYPGGFSIYGTVLNANGTINSCTNPAKVGSPILVVLNGAGLEPPTVTDQGGNTVLGAAALAGLPGVWLASIQPLAADVFPTAVPPLPAPLSVAELSLSVNGMPVREQNVTVWLTQ